MDEKQLQYEFLSILSESHPGLTFEEYRDSCVFLLFYQYLCLKHGDSLDDAYKPGELVKMAIRGKLQVASFLKFMESASSFLHLLNKDFQLTEFSFYKNLEKVYSLEKQKSYARFFRKFLKKIDGWSCKEELLRQYPTLFIQLITEFARLKKDTYISDALCKVYQGFFSYNPNKKEEKTQILLPEFQYGILASSVIDSAKDIDIYGYAKEQEYIDIFTILCYMKGIPLTSLHLFLKKDWRARQHLPKGADNILIFMPEGVEAGEYVAPPKITSGKEFFYSGTKGEFPFLLTALSCLRQNGSFAAVFPGAMLYREGREAQIRKYLVDELQCLDTIILLPDSVFYSSGQAEVFLFLQLNRTREEIMFFDCSESEMLDREQINNIKELWKERKTIPGFCACVSQDEIEKNEYNLNFPRYITKVVQEETINMEEGKKRIQEIDQELEEVEKRIMIYRRELGL